MSEPTRPTVTRRKFLTTSALTAAAASAAGTRLTALAAERAAPAKATPGSRPVVISSAKWREGDREGLCDAAGWC